MSDGTLDRLAIKHGTDKASTYHNYAHTYDKLFNHLRAAQITVLEIGAGRGQSLAMWEEYFPRARIIGIDIDSRCLQHERDRVFIRIGDQADPSFLANVGKEFEPFDIVIDDGSHQQVHQIASLKSLFPFVKSGGYYIIEDVTCAYSILFGGREDVMGNVRKRLGTVRRSLTYPVQAGRAMIYGTIVDYAKRLIDAVNLRGVTLVGDRGKSIHLLKEADYVERNVDCMMIKMGLIILEKASYAA